MVGCAELIAQSTALTGQSFSAEAYQLHRCSRKLGTFSAFWLISNVEKNQEGGRGKKKWRKIMLLYFSINATLLQLNPGMGGGKTKEGKEKKRRRGS